MLKERKVEGISANARKKQQEYDLSEHQGIAFTLNSKDIMGLQWSSIRGPSNTNEERYDVGVMTSKCKVPRS